MFSPIEKEHFDEMQEVIVEANRHGNPLLVGKIKTL